MSILGQTIPGNGQPLFPSKGYGAQDVRQHLSIALPLHGAHSAKSFLQPGDSFIKKPSLSIASNGSDSAPSRGESYCRIHELAAANRETFQNGILDGLTGDGISNPSNLLGSHIVDHSSSVDPPIMRADFHDEICQTALHSTVELEPLPLRFLRSRSVKPIKEQVHHLSSHQTNVAVSVSSAVKLKGGQIELIARKMKRLTGSIVLRLENTVDASLIAGFIISYDNNAGETQVIDLSVKGQLAALAAQAESLDQPIANFGFSSSTR